MSILCRVCQKRGTVPASPAKPAAPATSAGQKSLAAATLADPSRRRMLLLAAAGLGAIITGAVIARHPWRHWGEPAPTGSPDDPGRRRGPGGRGFGAATVPLMVNAARTTPPLADSPPPPDNAATCN